MKKIRSDISNFEELIDPANNYFYIDKTKYIFDLVCNRGAYYFLSRPRRFGKSLTISTMQAIFEGKKELFKDLDIYNEVYDWKEYPIIRLDFSNISYSSIENLKEDIRLRLIEIAEKYKVKIDKSERYYNYLRKLIITLRDKYDKVVILIDEYDSILSDNIDNDDISLIKKTLRDFYKVIKSSGDYIRFCFITGVTKFSKMSIFSTMNNLTDISFDEQFNTFLGYSEFELKTYFAEYIKKGSESLGLPLEDYINLLKDNYDGYSFYPTEKRVYNPVSINLFFSKGGEDFDSYWNDTGNTNILFESAKKTNFDITKDLDKSLSRDFIKSVDVLQLAKKNISKDVFMSLMFQVGYLTIKSWDEDRSIYHLGFPNKEVSSAFLNGLISLYLNEEDLEEDNSSSIYFELKNGNVSRAIEILKGTSKN